MDATCRDNKIKLDTGKNAVVGGIIGAAVGGGIGYAFGGPRGAVRGALGGAAAGAVGSALVTYYVEHQEADALADIEARNALLNEALESYQHENVSLVANARVLEAKIVEAKKDRSEFRKITDELKAGYETEAAFSQRLLTLVTALQSQLKDYKAAVNYKYHSIPPKIGFEIQRNEEVINSTEAIQKAAEKRQEVFGRLLNNGGVD